MIKIGSRVRVRFMVVVMFNVSIYDWSNCSRSKYRTCTFKVPILNYGINTYNI